jgi:hypothetical protein
MEVAGSIAACRRMVALRSPVAPHDKEENHMKQTVGMGRSYMAKAAVVGALAFGALVASAPAAEAQDRLNFTGSANLFDAPGSGGTLLFIDFLTGATGGPPTGTVTAKETINGVFDPEIVPDVTMGTIRDLTVGPTGVVGVPISNFLTIGGYTFSLNSTAEGNTFGPLSLIGTPAGTSGFFGVFGTVTGGDFGSMMHNYTGVFTAQFAGMTPDEVFAAVNSGGTLPVGFSAEFAIQQAVIPEPSTYLLMATGLGALGFIGRRRRTQA